MAHGYLLASFLSPLTNRRTDGYGGDIGNRLRYPLEVLAAVRAAWPDRPLSVRLSSSDWAPGGLTEDELLAVGRAMKAAGADLLDLSSGQTVPWQKPVYGRMWQTPFSDLVRNVVGIPTIAVGNIFEADHANTIIASGRADLCALARPHLADPAWTLRAAAEQHWDRPVVAAAVPVGAAPARAQPRTRGPGRRSDLGVRNEPATHRDATHSSPAAAAASAPRSRRRSPRPARA